MRAVVVTTLALFMLLLTGVPTLMDSPSAYTGVTYHSTGALVQPNVIDVEHNSPAYRAGLRIGDVGYVPGAAVSLCATRNGVLQHVSFVPDGDIHA